MEGRERKGKGEKESPSDQIMTGQLIQNKSSPWQHSNAASKGTRQLKMPVGTQFPGTICFPHFAGMVAYIIHSYLLGLFYRCSRPEATRRRTGDTCSYPRTTQAAADSELVAVRGSSELEVGLLHCTKSPHH